MKRTFIKCPGYLKRLFNMIDIMCDNDYVMVKLQCGNQELSTVTAAPYSRLKRRRPPLRHLRSFLSNTFQHHSYWRHSTLIMFHLDGVCAPVTAASNHKSVSDASYRRRPPGEKLKKMNNDQGSPPGLDHDGELLYPGLAWSAQRHPAHAPPVPLEAPGHEEAQLRAQVGGVAALAHTQHLRRLLRRLGFRFLPLTLSSARHCLSGK